jgi:hypothetical protein
MAMLLRTASTATIGVLLTACCGDDVRLVSLAFRPELLVSPSYAWVGDTITLYAAASTDPTSLLCSRVLYTAETEPQRFHFSSTDTGVGAINGRALFIARTLGVTRLVAVSAGISDSLWVIVAPAFTSLRVTVTPPTAHVGDTLTVQVDALDATGSVMLGAQVQRPQLLPPSDKLATWLPNDRPSPPFPSYTFPTPVIDRLVIHQAGVLAVLAAAPHDSGRPLHYVADSVFMTVTAP